MKAELRNWYLSTLGVTQYLPRSSVSVADSQADVAATVERQRQSLKSAIDLDSAQPKVEEKPEAQVSLPVDEQEAAAISFRLACWQPVDDLLVIDSLPPGEQPGSDRLKLLANILRAIDRLPGNGLPQAELIDWPVTAGGSAGETGARAMLSVFLEARIKKFGVCWVLLMGEPAATYIGNSIGNSSLESDSAVEIGQQRELSGSAKAILCHSLSRLLQEPVRKAETWQAIGFLAG